MFNYNLNFLKIIKENLAWFLQTSRRLDWIVALISPFKYMYNGFLSTRANYLYRIRFNSQICYLEHVLNDKFDLTLRRIYITNSLDGVFFWLFRKSENRTAVYFYRKWSSALSYATNQYAIDTDNNVYKSINPTTGVKPSLNPASWLLVGPVQIISRKSELIPSYSFTIHVPSSLVFNTQDMRNIVDYYRFASKTYNIVTF